MSTPLLNSFTSGELSPRLDARSDLPLYHHGAITVENLIILPQGGATFRPGTRYNETGKDDSLEAAEDRVIKLKTFIHTQTESFTIIFGHLSIRFEKDDISVEDSASPGNPKELLSPFKGREVQELKFTKVGNSFYIAHSGYHTRKLTWDGLTDDGWTLTDPIYTADPFTSIGNYPAAIGYQDQRLLLGGTDKDPTKFVASKIAAPENFTIGVNPDDAFEATFDSDENSRLNWMVTGEALILGTLGGEWRVTGGANGLGPGEIYIKRQTTFGTSQVQGRLIFGNIMFFQKSGEKLRNYHYSQEGQAFLSEDLSMQADHILKGGIVDFAYQQDPDPIIWMVRSDGKLIALTYDPTLGVTGFHRHPTNGFVESVTIRPSNTNDIITISVKRTIGGVVKHYLETFEARTHGNQEDLFFVDSGITATGVDLTEVGGLEHLEGEEVAVCVDGKEHPRRTVTAGTITLQDGETGYKIHVGLPYVGKIRTMKLDPGSEGGTAKTKKKRIVKVVLRFFETIGCRVGADEDHLNTINFNTAGIEMGVALPPFTGDKPTPFGGGYSRDGSILIVHEEPLPFTLLAIVPQVEVSK